MNILVVDDEPGYRLLMRNLLEECGYTIFLAEDGEQALERMHEVKMDLVISDVYMPVMDGIKFHKKLRQTPETENQPFLFVSGYDDHHTMESVRNPKIEGFLRKGRPANELKEWIKYLTAPGDKRSALPPGRKRNLVFHDRYQIETNVPIL